MAHSTTTPYISPRLLLQPLNHPPPVLRLLLLAVKIRRLNTVMGSSFGWVAKVAHRPEEARVRVKVRMPAARFKELAMGCKDGSDLGSLILRECVLGDHRCTITPSFSSEADHQATRSLSSIDEDKDVTSFISKKLE